jgi:hypothetical protein
MHDSKSEWRAAGSHRSPAPGKSVSTSEISEAVERAAADLLPDWGKQDPDTVNPDVEMVSEPLGEINRDPFI